MAAHRKPTRRPLVHKPVTVSPDADEPRHNRQWFALIVLGIALRFILASMSIGTNDAAAWLRFGDEINQHGLLKTYSIDPDFNHPPLPGYWAALCAKIAGDSDSPLHDSVFTFTFKLAPILGDCLAIYMVYLIWRFRRGRAYALWVAAMFALSLDAILISGFHCNTDSLLIALCLLCLYLYQDRNQPLLGGLALGAAINVKLIPVLLIPALLLRSRSWRDAALLTTGLAAGAVPFLPVVLEARAELLSNILRYNSMIDRWGVNFFLLLGEKTWVATHHGELLSAAYYAKARYLILILTGSWALFARLVPRWSLYEVVLITFAILLLLAPGFGVQYTVLVGLPLFAIRPLWAIAYNVLAGIFVGSAYFMYWTGSFPLYSHWGVLFPEPVGILGLVTWLTIAFVACAILIRPAPLAMLNPSRHNPPGP